MMWQPRAAPFFSCGHSAADVDVILEYVVSSKTLRNWIRIASRTTEMREHSKTAQ